jgi:hypothetical protein
VCSADDRISSWNECLQRDWGDGRVNINVSCNGSDIDVHFFVPVNSVLNNYYTCLLEYICILPNGSSTTPRAIPSPVVNLQPHYNVTTDTPLPGETVCTVRGCYEDIDYFLFAFNQSCTTDVNECIEDSSVCGQHGTCVNTHGSFRCDCHDGYQKNESSHDCIDINECEINTAECPEDATCMNRPGGYWCQLCDPKCHKDALCNTTMENPQCMCREGYTGDGYHCTSKSIALAACTDG